MNSGGNWIEQVLHGADLAAYEWDFASGRMHFSSSAARVLGISAEQVPDDVARFNAFLDAEFANIRQDIVVSARDGRTGEEGHAFRLEYRLHPRGRDDETSIWIRERGRWRPGADGRPERAWGLMERIDDERRQREVEEMQAAQLARGGMMDRCAFLRLLQERLASPEDAAHGMALLLISVRNLSVVADAYGFLAADEVYREVSRRIKEVMRVGDPIARFGEGRYAVLLHHCREDDVGPALRRLLAQPTAEVIETEHGPMWPMLSIGAALLPQHANTLANAVACAEEALAEAEGRPSSNAVIFTSSPDRISRRANNARRAHEILQALKENRFTIAFQPIVDAQDGKVRYHEALLRMRNAGGEIVSAGPLVSLAEKLGLIHLIDLNVLELAIRTLAEHPDSRLSCNVSGITVMDENWQQRLLDKLAGHASLIAGRLMVEITESAVLSDLDVIQRFIGQLHALGCKVAVDDFGAGYTSFRNLQKLDFDVIKIDGAFCEHLSENADHQHLVRSLVDLAHGTGMQIVAEWVVAQQDAQLLREWGVHLFQGHLFGAAQLDAPWPSPWLDRQWSAPILPVRTLEAPDAIRPAACVPADPSAEPGAGRESMVLDEASARPVGEDESGERDRVARGEDALRALETQITRLHACLERMRGAGIGEKEEGGNGEATRAAS